MFHRPVSRHRIRSRHRQLFESGDYIALHAHGAKSDHVIALVREFNGKSAIAVTPRLCLTLVNGETKAPLGPLVWGDTELELPRGNFRNHFTGKTVKTGKLGEILFDFPAALLENV